VRHRVEPAADGAHRPALERGAAVRAGRQLRIWTGTQVAALGTDTADKIDSVLNYFHIEVPGYDSVKEHART